jgi:rSAM/selenodomain-associated transferase 1
MEFKLLSPDRFQPELQNQCALGVMIKAPRVGFSKTRLSPPLAAAEAAQLSQCFLQDMIACFDRIKIEDVRATGVAIYTPEGSESEFTDLLPPGYAMIPQRDGEFGHRLWSAVTDLFAVGFGAVSLINSDSPTLPEGFLSPMVSSLLDDKSEAAIGPCADGGYYAIGLRRPIPELFQQITWSTDKVFAETLAQAKRASVQLQLLPPWYDVDEASSLDYLMKQLFAGPETGRGIAVQSKMYLSALLAKHGWDYFKSA